MTNKKISEEVAEFNHQVEESHLVAKAEVQTNQFRDGFALQTGDLVDRDIANQMHGKLAFLRGLNQFFRAAEIRMAKEVKERDLWRHIVVTDGDGAVRAARNFEDYCKHALGLSNSKVYESIKNYDVFGEALDGLQQMGVKRDQLRLLRGAPEGIIEEAKAAAEKHDKDALLELIDDLSARHAKEKEKLDQEKQELTDKVKHLESERQVDQRLLEDKERKLNELERELRRDLTPDQAAQKRAERDELLKSELMDKALSSISMLNELARAVEKIMDLEDRTDHLEESLYAELRGVFRHALLLGRQYDILPEQLLGIPVADLEAFDQVIEGETA
ncbi:hypothetical protein [Marinobacter salsuginis]|uniref:hypothetical protein n=1 Tax=Marinobacter salsuginis TaxID=418719 RepID=UPI00273E3EDC|nr:hypothetical protein [Marinobacter salsuginis]